MKILILSLSQAGLGEFLDPSFVLNSCPVQLRVIKTCNLYIRQS